MPDNATLQEDLFAAFPEYYLPFELMPKLPTTSFETKMTKREALR